jgi:hypothetical protein
VSSFRSDGPFGPLDLEGIPALYGGIGRFRAHRDPVFKGDHLDTPLTAMAAFHHRIGGRAVLGRTGHNGDTHAGHGEIDAVNGFARHLVRDVQPLPWGADNAIVLRLFQGGFSGTGNFRRLPPAGHRSGCFRPDE